ncbi:hypothetical protein BHL21_18735 [Bacillus cereus]|uniref:hypothetical protein n=1 Tax=Bacillus cereus TaxID=1396 RepID=UPI0009950FAC|nr:hypothetical protein [Bacillus cereus]OPA14908.1 hypothetical protein BHL21_18735 [Bacillus cereus]
MRMHPGFPDSTDFEPSSVQEVTKRWEFHRDPGSGGKNVGEDFKVPEGSVVVDYETHETSRHNTKGEPHIDLVFENSGPLRIPVGVHIGIRLTPEHIGGAGSGFTGNINMKIVSKADWYEEFLNGGPH